MKTSIARTLATAAAAISLGAMSLVAISFGASTARAGTYGYAPWCAVINVGAGTVTWDCEYRSAEECIPHVIAGNRGFCNMNPSFVQPAAATPAKHRKPHS
jgi:hypothetical protein